MMVSKSFVHKTYENSSLETLDISAYQSWQSAVLRLKL